MRRWSHKAQTGESIRQAETLTRSKSENERIVSEEESEDVIDYSLRALWGILGEVYTSCAEEDNKETYFPSVPVSTDFPPNRL